MAPVIKSACIFWDDQDPRDPGWAYRYEDEHGERSGPIASDEPRIGADIGVLLDDAGSDLPDPLHEYNWHEPRPGSWEWRGSATSGK